MRPVHVATLVLVLTAAAPRAASAQVCGEIPEILILMDRSGSMKEMVTTTSSKWDIGKAALTSLAKQFDTQLRLGLLLYPLFPDTTACATGKVNVAPALSNYTPLVTALNTVYPKGNTPLTASLDAAASYFKASTSKLRYVIVVTDGKETCLTPSASATQPGSCQWQSGTNFRKCLDCGWQFCLSSGVWSTACGAKPDVFTCPEGQTCGSSAKCTGTITGSTDAKKAMANLAAAGTKGYVIGFGANVDAKVLTDLAVAGGTSNYSYAANLTQLSAALQAVAAAISCCGNGQLDTGELCDKKIPAGQTGACPASCSDGDACTKDSVTGSECSVKCAYAAITQAVSGDGCCPTGATSGTDSDCPASCGNGVLDSGETCDPGIAKGQTGACDLTCDDNDACTTDAVGGSACIPKCTTTPVVADATKKDGCCPTATPPLVDTQDPDCKPACSPQQPTDCVDQCKGKQCPPGTYCKWGKCIPWEVDGGTGDQGFVPMDLGTGGCDCRVGADGSTGAAGALALAALLLGLALRRRPGQ